MVEVPVIVSLKITLKDVVNGSLDRDRGFAWNARGSVPLPWLPDVWPEATFSPLNAFLLVQIISYLILFKLLDHIKLSLSLCCITWHLLLLKKTWTNFLLIFSDIFLLDGNDNSHSPARRQGQGQRGKGQSGGGGSGWRQKPDEGQDLW